MDLNTTHEWWNKKDDEVHEVVFPYVKSLETYQNMRRMNWLQFARLYQNQSPTAWSSSVINTSVLPTALSQWTSYNICKSSVDTATNKIGKNRPRSVFLTEEGSWEQQDKAKKLTQFLDGQNDYMKKYLKAQAVFRDAGVFGTGILKYYIDEKAGTVNCERVLVDEIIVDDADALYGNPTQIFHRKYVDRKQLLARYPLHAKAIEAAASAFTDLQTTQQGMDLIKVIEAWKLPSEHGAKDGKKALVIDGATLQVSIWEKDWFPFIAWRWCDRVAGFYGMGIIEELYGTQLEINKLLRNIQLAQHLIAVPRIFLMNGSTVSAKIDNTIGAVVKTTGQAPVFNTPTAMSGEIYGHLKWLVQAGYEQIGISQMSATGQKPVGLESAPALREYNDQQSERFEAVGQRWEEFHLAGDKIAVELNKDLMAMAKKSDGKTKAPSIKVQDADFLRKLDWSKIDLDEDKYILRMFPASLLPTTPGGKIAKVLELVQAGLIPQDQALRLLDFPDFKGYLNQALASEMLTDKMIDLILRDGKYMAPEPEMDLPKASSIAQKRYLQAKVDGVPPERLSLLERWKEAVKGMLPANPMPVTPMDPMAQQPGQIAQPEAAPVSPLVPFNQ